jgi:hypothetical protein
VSLGRVDACFLLPHAVRIEVHDHAEQQPAPRSLEPLDESGRGLTLIEELALAWGVEPAVVGKTVWFEVPRLDHSAARPS